jgi:NADH-quinone oxidoreductase subunit D
MINEHAFVGAVEQLLDLDVPRRAEYIRVIVDELQRIASHLVWLGTYLLDLGAFTPINYCFRDRDEILEMFETLGGSRFNVNYMRVGGVLADLPMGFLGRLEKFLHRFIHTVDELEELIGGNEIFEVRTMNVGRMSPELGIAYGISGPCLRASGVNFDIRTFRPYSIYPELGVVPQVEVSGDAFARYQVRMNEMRESVRLIQRAIEGLPGGPVRARMPHLLRPPKGESYYTVESPRGEMGYYLISDGSTNPYRAKVRPPCFVNLQILPELLRGARIGDVVSVLGSIDIILGEVDR